MPYLLTSEAREYLEKGESSPYGGSSGALLELRENFCPPLDTIAAVEEKLGRDHIACLVGLPGMGKTSLLLFIHDKYQKEPGFETEFLQIEAGLPPSYSVVREVQKRAKETVTQGKKLLVVIDEIDRLSTKEISQLGMLTRQPEGISVVLASLVSQPTFEMKHAFGEPIFQRFLTQEEAFRVIQREKDERFPGGIFHPLIVQEIARLSAGHPEIATILARDAFNAIRKFSQREFTLDRFIKEVCWSGERLPGIYLDPFSPEDLNLLTRFLTTSDESCLDQLSDFGSRYLRPLLESEYIRVLFTQELESRTQVSKPQPLLTTEPQRQEFQQKASLERREKPKPSFEYFLETEFTKYLKRRGQPDFVRDYLSGRPVGSELYYGRGEEQKQARRMLEDQRSVIIYGSPRWGKTSLMNHLASSLEKKLAAEEGELQTLSLGSAHTPEIAQQEINALESWLREDLERKGLIIWDELQWYQDQPGFNHLVDTVAALSDSEQVYFLATYFGRPTASIQEKWSRSLLFLGTLKRESRLNLVRQKKDRRLRWPFKERLFKPEIEKWLFEQADHDPYILAQLSARIAFQCYWDLKEGPSRILSPDDWRREIVGKLSEELRGQILGRFDYYPPEILETVRRFLKADSKEQNELLDEVQPPELRTMLRGKIFQQIVKEQLRVVS